MTQGTKLFKIVKRTIAEYSMIQPGSRVVAAVSGGPDSMALLHLLLALGPDMDMRITVAHLDHGLRKESLDDVEFVRTACSRLGVPVNVLRRETADLAAKWKVSIEEAGRRARYAFLEEVRSSTGASVIATGHHRDDSLETFFLRLFRGSSLAGLGGVPPIRGPIIRPLINANRTDIMGFLEEEGIPYRIDRTNLEADVERNFVRNRIFPTIEEKFPNFRAPVSRTLDLVSRESRFLDLMSHELMEKYVERGRHRIVVRLPGFLDASPVLQARVVVQALFDVSGPHIRWTRAHLNEVLAVMSGRSPSGRTALPKGWEARREYDRLVVEHVSNIPGTGLEASPCRLKIDDPRNPVSSPLAQITGPGRVDVPEARLSLTVTLTTVRDGLMSELNGKTVVAFDAERIQMPLVVRFPQYGDRLDPWGMTGTRKLKDMFIDLKIPSRDRWKIPLITQGTRILWVIGIRRGRTAPVGPETKSVMKIRASEMSSDR
ncbi:MAG: tRNA lysidine(34) synthetase TilS [Pseudomonadota bacterium]